VDTPTLLLALFTVLVGDDPVRRLAIRSRGEGSWYGVIRPEGMDWRNDVHDVRPFIPAGTPVERVVVLPAVAEAPVEKRWDAGRLCLGGEDALSAEDALETAGHLLRRAACQRMIAAAFAARAAEPTPDPLAQARERERVDAVVRTVCPCTCEAAYYERNLTMPGCLWHDGGEDVSLLLQEAGLLAATEGGAS
jgi:hypothetical protein